MMSQKSSKHNRSDMRGKNYSANPFKKQKPIQNPPLPQAKPRTAPKKAIANTLIDRYEEAQQEKSNDQKTAVQQMQEKQEKWIRLLSHLMISWLV